MRMIIMNGLLFCLILMWTSVATGLATGPGVNGNASRVGIQLRQKACRNLGGRCVKKRKDCPNQRPLETQPGKPYCSRKRRCCYPEQSRCGIQNRIVQCVKYNGIGECGRHPVGGVIPAFAWCYIDQQGAWKDCGRVPCRAQQDWNWRPCVRHNGVAAVCGKHRFVNNGQQIIPTYAWCYTGNNNVWGYCTNPCAIAPSRFTHFHVCRYCNSNLGTLAWVRDKRPNIPESHRNAVFSNIQENIAYTWSTFTHQQYTEDTCKIDVPVRTWLCKARFGADGLIWHECEDKGICTGLYAVINGHFLVDSRSCT